MTVKEAEKRKTAAGRALDAAVKREFEARWAWRKAKIGSRDRVIKREALRDRKQETRKAELKHAEAKRALRLALKARKPLREKAYDQAVKLIGVMERGGNNVGAEVEKIIREGGGLRGQAWCGWFCAAVYKRAGSKAPSWHWGAVRLYIPLSGVSRTSSPKRGDLVRFTFDHIGMFVKDNGNGTIETIEGNTGSTGAVSDSATGGDGVYRKTRSKSLVRDYLHITR